MDNLTGMDLGRYHILEPLGEGGMATVYKAYDTRLERDVAVKIIRRQAFPEEQLERILKRFEREAKALAKLTHPNIVGVIDYGSFEGSPYLVMEYLPGGTLKQRLGAPIPWQEAARLLLPIAQALDYAHEEKILHRDVKPSNILLTTKGQPMLSDFGIAKILDLEEGQTLTGTGVGLGTPEYMSPEQGMGKSVDGRTDVYSLGVMFYELVTGRKPFSADTPMAVVLKHLQDALPRPRQFTRDLPEMVEKVIIKALAKKPEDRYQSMGEFAGALEGLLSDEKRKTKNVKEESSEQRSKTSIKNIPIPVTAEVTQDEQAAPASPAPPGKHGGPAHPGISGAKPIGPIRHPLLIAGIALAVILLGLLVGLLLRKGTAIPPAIMSTDTLLSSKPPASMPTEKVVPPASAGCANSKYITDVTIPDGTELSMGQEFTKTWRIQNTGTCEWTTDFKLAFSSGEVMDGQPVAFANPVTPGQQVDLSINLKVPDRSGKLTSVWKLVDDKGQPFGTILTAMINVAMPSPTPILGIGSTWTRPADGMVMVYVPQGDFTMGSPAGTGNDDEHPQHTVSLDAFWIDRTDVTNAMFARCVQAGKCQPPYSTKSYTRASYYGNSQYDDYPVIYVDWNQASAYCQWAGAALPSEAQWEKAARGADGRTYPWGNDSPTCSLAIYSGCGGDTSAVAAHPSGASPYGALDMAGNVWQWVADWYDIYPGGAANSDYGQKYRVLRGGTWFDVILNLRSANRFRSGLSDSDNGIGFRCSRSLP